MKKLTMLITLAAVIIGARIIYACNVTNGGPCHTATSKTYDITCPSSYWSSACFCYRYDNITETVTDTTGDGNRIISCGTASTGLDGTTTGSATCSYDQDTHYCATSLGIYVGINENTSPVSTP